MKYLCLAYFDVEKYEAMPQGSRASQLWTHRIDSLFLDTFGRPDPNQDPPCERISEGAVTQVLHLMNGPDIFRAAAIRRAGASLATPRADRPAALHRNGG